jgi:replication factor C subunit 3/5
MDNSLWIEKYRPLNIDKFCFHQPTLKNLKTLVQQEDFPHIIFYGPSGSGKRTLIKACLCAIYGVGSNKVKLKIKEFEYGVSSKVECAVVSSNYHFEVTPAEAGIHDKVIIQKLIKDAASSMQLESEKQRSFKVVVLNDVDYLTKEAQAGLRRTMEKYMGNCRIFMNCENISKVILPVRSRCLLIRVGLPTETELHGLLQKIAQKECVMASDDLLWRIAKESNRNARRGIMLLQSMSFSREKLNQSAILPIPESELKVREIVTDILREQTPKKY